MLVNIHFSNFDKKLKYNLEDTIKIIEIKELIEKEENIPFTKTELKLIFSGRVLDNNKCLKDIKFLSGDTISALGKKIVQVENEVNTEVNTEVNNDLVENILNSNLGNEYLSYLNYFNENPLEEDLLNSYLHKYKCLINNVINNETFCNFIKNKDDINLISSESSNLSIDEYKIIALNIKEQINLFTILTNKLFYIIIIPTIHSYKTKYNLNEISNTEILSNIFTKINEYFNEYIELNGNLELSYHESNNNNENSIFTNIFNMINTILNTNSESQNLSHILNSNNNVSINNFNNTLNSLLNTNNNVSNINNTLNSLSNTSNNINNTLDSILNTNYVSNININNNLNNDIIESNIDSSSVNNLNLINSYNYDIELLNQMKDLGLTDTNKCKFCLNLSNGNLEMAINYYYEINIDFVNNENLNDEDEDDEDD